MDIYLIDPAGPQLRLPINPSEVNIRREKQYDTVNIMNIGEIDFAQGEKVKEITFSAFFSKDYDPSYCRYPDLPEPQGAMNQLTAWMMSKKPIRLIITGTIINALVLLAAHNSIFKGGEPGDVYYDLVCRTWREVKVRTTAEAAAGTGGVTKSAGRSRADTKTVPKVYTVRAGDSLWKIAKAQLGDGSKYRVIYESNKKIIGPDPSLIKPGQKLVIPNG